MIAGEYILAQGDISANVGREMCTVQVVNTGDRPIQIGSHFHFFEVNKALAFDREAAYGMRLNIPSGNAVRFEPGELKTVLLVAFGGHRSVRGFHQLVNGQLDASSARSMAEQAYEQGFKGIHGSAKTSDNGATL